MHYYIIIDGDWFVGCLTSYAFDVVVHFFIVSSEDCAFDLCGIRMSRNSVCEALQRPVHYSSFSQARLANANTLAATTVKLV